MTDLDPGIASVVHRLRDQGFDTTDSGDGVSKPEMGCALDYPHVFIQVDEAEFFTELRRLASLWPDWRAEGSASPGEPCVLLLRKEAL